jgi:hypothetical protein
MEHDDIPFDPDHKRSDPQEDFFPLVDAHSTKNIERIRQQVRLVNLFYELNGEIAEHTNGKQFRAILDVVGTTIETYGSTPCATILSALHKMDSFRKS